MTFRPSLIAFVGLAVSILAAGCSGRPSNVKDVTGTVTLGGQPLADALVTFSPVSGKSPSIGKTDATGKYELVYTRDVMGAEVGEHTVSISTFQEGDPDGDPPTPSAAEKVPLAYRDGTKPLKATVASGSNTIDFALEPGPVDPPMPKGKGKRPITGCF